MVEGRLVHMGAGVAYASEPRQDDQDASVDAWPLPSSDVDYATLTDDQALQMLRHRNSGWRPRRDHAGYRFLKRGFDIVASGAAIVVLAIPSAILCAAIEIKSPGASPLYSQWRVGQVGPDGSFRFFRMWKFRSMVPHADQMLAELQDENEADGPLFKIHDDPRIIPGIGNFIRRHSIDELPQLLNVFVGDMTLIGPRPGLPKEAVQYSHHDCERLTVRPGCGGAWQAGARSDSTFAEMVQMDLEYIHGRSVASDWRLIWGTVRTMFTGGGAY